MNPILANVFQYSLALCGAVVFFAALLCLCIARAQTWEGGDNV